MIFRRVVRSDDPVSLLGDLQRDRILTKVKKHGNNVRKNVLNGKPLLPIFLLRVLLLHVFMILMLLALYVYEPQGYENNFRTMMSPEDTAETTEGRKGSVDVKKRKAFWGWHATSFKCGRMRRSDF